ncbi:acetyl-CoA carboxylase biotin carboxyl carrier protein [Pseudoflavonifractor sp. 524-17]|uniref:acetyl-CoA carboxylase biotin carboxyl carrier protein n=1 Tax=Pseudoflavonifractor sp. 524-17 TaxID=2304577 RepID=UPI00137A0CAF|nr:acetyl-CoA carboxylase biotin carboxyl carrier protein [Pseudoflavonifractor sp. 524-17]NCE63551.1 acetyl-CoA carboxylase biotin carboxyl carrier protein [Pseudoflavonifractor sp. 524-17]
MELKDIVALMDRFEHSAIRSMEVELGDVRVWMDKNAPDQGASSPHAQVPACVPQPIPAPAEPEQPQGAVIKAPLVGTFYAAPAPDAAPFAPPGTAVKKGQTVCILEAMKMMSEVPAPQDGVIGEVLVSDGALVGFDQPLFRYK